MTRNNNTLSWRVVQLEKQVESMDVKMYKLMSNDLPHLHEKLGSLETRINVLTMVNIGAILLALVVNKFL